MLLGGFCKLVFMRRLRRNEFCLKANELAYAMNCPTGMNCAAAHKESGKIQFMSRSDNS